MRARACFSIYTDCASIVSESCFVSLVAAFPNKTPVARSTPFLSRARSLAAANQFKDTGASLYKIREEEN
jgi:hypothetical protein